MEPYLKPPTTPQTLRNPGGTSWNLVKPPQPSQNPGGTFVEPYPKPPHPVVWWILIRTTPQPLQNLVEPWWNLRGTLAQTTPDHPAALAEPGGTLVEPSWNLTSTHPLVEPGGTLPQTTPDHRRTWWNPGGTLVVEPCLKPPRTTPQPL